MPGVILSIEILEMAILKIVVFSVVSVLGVGPGPPVSKILTVMVFRMFT